MSPWKPLLSKSAYLEAIRCIQGKILDGESYECCLTNRFEAGCELDAFQLYRHLRRANPAPFAAYLKTPDTAVLSSSPERFLRVDGTGVARTEPIKGTGLLKTGREARLRRALMEGEKEGAELMMITDLLRNDFAKVCEPGSVQVESVKRIQAFGALLQMSSVIQGKLRDSRTAIDLLAACFPGGSISGAPKIRSMEILEALEAGPRGCYTGAIGYLNGDGSADLSIAIRTLEWTPGSLRFGAGGAIVADSNPDMEWREMLWKARPILNAVQKCLRETAAPRRAKRVNPNIRNQRSRSVVRQ